MQRVVEFRSLLWPNQFRIIVHLNFIISVQASLVETIAHNQAIIPVR